MDVKTLGERLEAINQEARSANDNLSIELHEKAQEMADALQKELDENDADLAVEWSYAHKRFILKWY